MQESEDLEILWPVDALQIFINGMAIQSSTSRCVYWVGWSLHGLSGTVKCDVIATATVKWCWRFGSERQGAWVFFVFFRGRILRTVMFGIPLVLGPRTSVVFGVPMFEEISGFNRAGFGGRQVVELLVLYAPPKASLQPWSCARCFRSEEGLLQKF